MTKFQQRIIEAWTQGWEADLLLAQEIVRRWNAGRALAEQAGG